MRNDPIHFFGIRIFRSPAGKTTGLFGIGFSLFGTATLCYGTGIKYSGFSSFGSPFGGNRPDSFGSDDPFGTPPPFAAGSRLKCWGFSYSFFSFSETSLRHPGPKRHPLRLSSSGLFFPVALYSIFPSVCQEGFLIFLYFIHNSHKTILHTWSY